VFGAHAVLWIVTTFDSLATGTSAPSAVGLRFEIESLLDCTLHLD
jgi:hypothetical protein